MELDVGELDEVDDVDVDVVDEPTVDVVEELDEVDELDVEEVGAVVDEGAVTVGPGSLTEVVDSLVVVGSVVVVSAVVGAASVVVVGGSVGAGSAAGAGAVVVVVEVVEVVVDTVAAVGDVVGPTGSVVTGASVDGTESVEVVGAVGSDPAIGCPSSPNHIRPATTIVTTSAVAISNRDGVGRTASTMAAPMPPR